MIERLIHYSTADTLWPLHARAQPVPFSEYDKPKGLWVSVEGENDWKEWCESEGFIGGNQFAFEVQLSPDAKIKRITGALEIDIFTDRYGIETRFRRGINWPLVAEKYHGIIIAPTCAKGGWTWARTGTIRGTARAGAYGTRMRSVRSYRSAR